MVDATSTYTHTHTSTKLTDDDVAAHDGGLVAGEPGHVHHRRVPDRAPGADDHVVHVTADDGTVPEGRAAAHLR